MIKRSVIIFTILLSITFGQAQQHYVDSLKRELTVAEEDTSKVSLLNQLSRAHTYSAPDTGVAYAEKALELAEKIDFKAGIILAEINLAGAFTDLGNFQQGIYYALNAHSLAEETKDYFLIIRSNAKLTECYYYFGEYTTALKYAHEELKMVAVYFPDRIFLPWANIAKVYQGMGQFDSALFFARKAYGIKAIKRSIVEAYNLVTIGNALAGKSKYDSALFYYHEGIPVAITNNVELDLIDLYNGIAAVHKIKNNLDSALWFSKRVLAEKKPNYYPLGILKATDLLSGIYALQNKPDSSLKYLRLAIGLKDSLFDREKTMAVQNVVFNEQERQKRIEASRLKYQNQLKLFSLLIGLVAVLIIAIVLFKNNRQRKIAYIQLEGQKAKTEQTLTELKSTQAQLIQSEKMASLGELTAGIAHEIQNPLNFVNNFSEVNKELIEELRIKNEKLKIEDDEVNDLLNDLADNEEKINHHGKRADAIVKNMLQHSRKKTGEKEPTDINALCDEYLRLVLSWLACKRQKF